MVQTINNPLQQYSSKLIIHKMFLFRIPCINILVYLRFWIWKERHKTLICPSWYIHISCAKYGVCTISFLFHFLDGDFFFIFMIWHNVNSCMTVTVGTYIFVNFRVTSFGLYIIVINLWTRIYLFICSGRCCTNHHMVGGICKGWEN